MREQDHQSTDMLADERMNKPLKLATSVEGITYPRIRDDEYPRGEVPSPEVIKQARIGYNTEMLKHKHTELEFYEREVVRIKGQILGIELDTQALQSSS